MNVRIIGAGAWGTALGTAAIAKGNDVLLWSYEEDVARDINGSSRNERYLPGVDLPKGMRATSDLAEAADGADAFLLAVPSPFLLGVARKLVFSPRVAEGDALVVVVTKGFIMGPHGPRLIVETLEDYLPGFYRGNIVYLSGPSLADEVARGRITGLVAACANGRSAIRTREMLRSPRLLVFPSLDIVGVQVCAAAKNVIAIAFGMLEALAAKGEVDFGDNTESLLLAAGLAEIQALGATMGSTHPETFTSISGVGDLDVTCRSGRNRRFGREIVETRVLDPFASIGDLTARITELPYLPEGVVACGHIEALAREKGVSMPISQGVYRILDKQVGPADFIRKFLSTMGGE